MTLYDWLAILLYLGSTIAIGLWLSRKQDDLEDYFLGGRSIPWWAALLSMVATETSAATFLGAPEQGYIRNMTYLQFSVGTIAARFVLASVFIAAFYRLRVLTIYGFLAERFGPPTQTTTAAVFLLGRLFASGARLFIGAIAIEVATGLSLSSSIVLLGMVAVVYTWFGGIKAVIWTDVLQAIVLVGGGVIALVSLFGDVPLTFSETVDFLAANDKFRIFDLGDGSGWDILTNPYHVVPAVIGGFFLTMATHGTDHDMVQRLLTCRESREGQRSLWMSGFIGLLVTTLFLGVGQMLFVYVAHLPAGEPMGIAAEMLADSGKNGHFFLHYIVSGLPAGVTGLVLAAVFAAAMSSLDSAMAAMSATFVSDIYRPHFHRNGTQRHYLLAGRLSMVVIGVLLVGVALLVVYYYEANPQTDLLSIALGVMTFFYGALLGIFLLGFLTRDRGNTMTNAAGAIISILLVLLIKQTTSIGWPWFIVMGTLVCFAVAYAGRTAAVVADRYADRESETR